MGTIKKGILGGFSGKVGTVIGSSWRGLDVMRSLPKQSKAVPTEEQAIQRLRFGLIMGFLSPFKAIIEKAYGATEGAKSKFNLCTSYHLKEAVVGTAPDFSIDYSKVVLTKGELLGPKAAEAAAGKAGEIVFTWENHEGAGLAATNDKVLMVLYSDAKKLAQAIESNVERSGLKAKIALPASFTGETFHCWLGFLSADGKRSSTSVYLGEALLPKE